MWYLGLPDALRYALGCIRLSAERADSDRMRRNPGTVPACAGVARHPRFHGIRRVALGMHWGP